MGMNDTFTGGYTSKLTLDDLEKTMALIEALKPQLIIKVWKGHFNCYRTDRPPIFRVSELVDDDIAYVVAGLGLIAGKGIFPKIQKFNPILEWVDKPCDATKDIFS